MNTSQPGQEECTLWYDQSTGKILGLGPTACAGASMHIRVDNEGLLPEIVSADNLSPPSQAASQVLESIQSYRARKQAAN